ncbi:TRAF-like family protein [Citrus sinensis]|uniref:TRAF-like family protein n=1 Tax=Citrus sinensis TaxID=2711 RepID=A0ACB8KGB4_CITSI|nr:TRAF-like family protein [Citrus sinensis]
MADTCSLTFGWEVYAVFRLFLLDQNQDIYLVVQDALGKERRFNGLKLQWGLDQFIPLEAFNDSTNGYLVKDTCVFGAEVFVKERSRVKGECLSMEKYAYSSKYVWKIDNFSKLGAGYKESQAFGAGNHKWKIELHPAGIDIGAADHLSMFLILENFTVENVQVYAEFTLRIWDQLGQSMNLFKLLSCIKRSIPEAIIGLSMNHPQKTAASKRCRFGRETPSENSHEAECAFDNYLEEFFSVESSERSTSKAPPAHYIVKIKSFSLLAEKAEEEYESGEFEVGGYKWYVYCMGKERRFNGLKHVWGFDKFIPLRAFNDALNGYLVEDTCVFDAEVLVKERNKFKGECLSMKEIASSSISRSISHVPPAHFLLKIQEFSSLVENELEIYESLEFDAGGHKWKLVVYPNGNENKNVNDHISLYLEMADTSSLGFGWEVYPIFRLFVLDQNKDEFLILQEVLVKERNKCKGECLSMTKLTSASIYKHVWKIENFSKLEAKRHESEVFIVRDQKWKIQLHPKGIKSGTGSHVSMSLALVDSSTITPGFKIYVHFTLRIRDQVRGKHKEANTSIWFRSSWGWPRFAELSYLNEAGNGFLVNDGCIVEAEVSVLGISKAL